MVHFTSAFYNPAASLVQIALGAVQAVASAG